MSRTKDVVHESVSSNNNQSIQSQANKNTTVLETSGILDAYEYFLRQLCKNGLPSGNVYEFAAQQILKFERKRNTEIKKRVALKNSIDALETQQTQQDQIREKKITKSNDKNNYFQNTIYEQIQLSSLDFIKFYHQKYQLQQKDEIKKGQQASSLPPPNDKQQQNQNDDKLQAAKSPQNNNKSPQNINKSPQNAQQQQQQPEKKEQDKKGDDSTKQKKKN